MDTSSTSSPTLLESLFNHIALPPRLPGKHERSIEQIGHALIVRLLNASRFLRDLTNNEFRDQWDCIRRILQTCKTVHSGGRVNKSSLLTEFRTLEHKDLLILHITEQNAGLLIRRHHDAQGQSVIFEAFEVSPLSESVIASENALQWDFPGCAIAIPFSEFNNASFQDNLATFLEQASTEPIKRFAAHTNKAGSFAFESRDTVDPSLITQMLMTFLEVNGHRIFPPLLRKRVRDDVCWTNGAQNPWRRCSFWLLLRVGIQRHLCTLLGSEVGRVHYKFLICLVLARLLEETLTHLNPELLAFLKAKLCRRLVKLEVDKDRASQSTRTAYEYLFAALGPLLYKTTQNATEHINTAWISLKKTMRRPILPLPCRADPRDLYLTLPNSGLYLQKVLDEYLYESRGPRSSVPYQLPVDYDISAPITSHQRAFAQLYFSLSETETDMAKNHLAELDAKVNSEIRCIKLVKKLETYLDSVAGVYDSNPEQKSIMLLTVMEIWMSIDECAINLFRLIRDYNPGFVPEILDVLQLPHFEDMLRLQKIQNYLKDRNTSCKYSRMTIFSDPTKGCFAEQFFNESDRLQELYQDIKDVAELAYTRKEQEWQRLSTEYENLIKAIAESSCVFTTDEMPPFLRIHDDRHCTKCFLQRKARRVKIQVHEHPLPSNPIQAKAVVFELGCPKAFTRYRDVTWRILRTLACPKKTNGVEPRVLLRDYSELKSFNNSTTCSLSLASESKSFLASHYSQVRFPMGLEAVCLPNGLKYGYFDILTKVWSGEQAQKPTFAHHCRMTIPTNSPFSSYQSSLDITVDRPSSYEVVASQTRCPPGLNVHEFMAYQALFSGKNRRWPAILIELGSSNLNFSTEATTLLISQLALQVGPTYENDTLRTIHRVFRDESFCRRLIDQLSQRLNGISSNWRETHCMEMLIVLILRLCSLASEPSVISAAVKLVEMARAFTFQWINLLRAEVQKATDADTSQRCSRYALWAALLCRRTFDLDAKDGENLQPTALRCFVECSITLQDNLVGDPGSLPALLRNALIRDLKMVYRMRFILRRSIEASPGSMVTAINTMWPEAEGSPARSSSGLEFLPHPYEEWIQLIFDATEHTMQQTIHYHLLEGYLFVDGKPLGKLPAEYRKSMTLRQLFDNQSLLTYPSGLYGMTYMLAIRMYGHQIHLGFHKGKLIIRARVRGTILEFVPQEVFSGSSTFDLPAWLVHDCVHWLDLRTGIMEIRKRPDIWKSKTSNWAVDLHTRQAKRRRVSLVDPQSVLFQQIATIFDLFEYRHHLTVFQPTRGNLSVEMRRLELTFVVNNKSLLESSQLRSEIDPDQDAGTWYGLNSKLVLRDAINPHQRSIIVPTGRLLHKRKGFHVTVTVENNGKYGRFIINNIIGRIDCPAEPLLLYLKAQFHAYTSFVIPDTLTGRTGAEESLHCLKSGYCQPWTSLRPGPYQILKSISELTPKRCYYPKDMKVMQEVAWNEDLTTSIQHDAFRPIIEEICKKSEQLSIFASQKTELPSLEFAGDPHLLHRGYSRRHLYSRSNIDSDEQEAVPDLPYDARDRYQISQGSVKVFETVSLIRKWASKMPTTSDLAGIFQNWPTVGGYDRSFDKMLLSDRLAVQFDLEWGSLVNFCRISEPKDKFRLMFLLAVVSFCNDVDMDIVRTLIAFAVLEDLKALSPPKWPSYTQFRQNQIPSIDHLFPLMKDCCFPYPDDDRDTLQDLKLSFKQRKKFEAAELAHERQTESDCKALAQFLLEQWPCLEPTIEGFSRPVLVNVAQAMEMIRPEWKRLFQNMELSYHIQQVQLILDRHRTEKNIEAPSNIIKTQEVLPTRYRGGEFPSLSRNLLRKAGPALSKELSIISNRDSSLIAGKCFDRDIGTVPGSHFLARDTVTTTSYEIRELNDIINGLTGCQSAVRQQYGRDLMQSLNALRVQKSIPEQSDESINFAMLSVEITKSQQALNDQFNKICRAFEQSDSRVQWLQEGGLWPCITPVTLLEQLRSTSSSIFGDRMKENLVIYALSITALQRLTRMKDAHRKNDTQKLAEEQKNAGHRNWNPLKYPDWLLLEIDANILIRPEQVDVALTTISPASRLNSVLQMNMGQGKTSCIMPMAAAVLADSSKLLRVVIPKPLLLQTAQLLQTRLGGLLGREVRHIPFSRKTSTKSDIINELYNIHRTVLESSGVMLALPEHILSFMLSGLQRLSDARIPEASQMVKVQSWMKRVCRDILDECDITLAVRTQLIYPSGSQQTVDGHPHRWEMAQALLWLVEGHLWNLQQKFPQSLEVVSRPGGGFPVVFFLRQDVEDDLIARLVNDVCSGRISIVPTRDCTKSDRLAIEQFISGAKVRRGIIQRIDKMFPDKPAARNCLYLLRGLLVHRILLLALKKRWNVQYGLNPDRDPIAVPFHAKGVPSEQAEWGHPDVAILFTCLAFYYGGLTITQIRQSLEHLLKSDDPSSEYDRWIHSSGSLPDSLREWNAINVDDGTQLMEIWKHVRYNVVVVDYFLNNFVFPKHAKQFQIKLQASGWDIPLLPPRNLSLATPEHPKSIGGYSQALTTGFSGTNDNKTMLPLTIKQEDLSGLSHTNAEVLTYLLQHRSRQYVLAADEGGRRLSELDLLKKFSEMKIRILIDAGAQILEMDNLSLVKAWLSVDYEAPAAVFFDPDNRPFVLYRHGLQIPLVASPFAENLADCLVYLDEAHTRGTDLKIPMNARGALTLGLGQTKDHTVQAAMRMRQLATSQSISFFAPPEVHQSILDLRKKKSGDLINSYDVICWLLEQTCSGIEQLQPLYYSQGVDFCRRTQAALSNRDFLVDKDQRSVYLEDLRQAEQQTLEQLYRPKTKVKPAKSMGSLSPELATYMKELNVRRQEFQDTGNAVHGSALQEVEQEREVAYEVEAVREVQKPVHYPPLSFPGLHRDIISFIMTGRLAAGSAGYEQAFETLQRTALGKKHGISSEATASKLYVSSEFTKTISLTRNRPNDNFQRHINWILWSTMTETAIVVIPEEAELIIPLVYENKAPLTHLLTYSAPVTRKMLHFNNLDFYAIPGMSRGWKAPMWLIIELGIFAGRLYFEYEEYKDLQKYLGFQEAVTISTEATDNRATLSELNGIDKLVDGSVDGLNISTRAGEVQSFTTKPLTFLQEWLALRRKGQDFTHTPMGYVCQGKPLSQNHPFFRRVEDDGVTRIEAVDMRTGHSEESSAGTHSTDSFSSSETFDDDDDGDYSDDRENKDGILDESDPDKEAGIMDDKMF